MSELSTLEFTFRHMADPEPGQVKYDVKCFCLSVSSLAVGSGISCHLVHWLDLRVGDPEYSTS